MLGSRLDKRHFDITIVGAGFYGLFLARYFRNRGFSKVLVIEQSDAPMMRASYRNQARIHGGYHYPRSQRTARASARHLDRFVEDFPASVSVPRKNLYGIAAEQSKVSSKKFELAMKRVGANLIPASSVDKGLFAPGKLEEVFRVNEPVVDMGKVRHQLLSDLPSAGVAIWLGSKVTDCSQETSQGVKVEVASEKGQLSVTSEWVFNCSYSGIDALGCDEEELFVQHEVAEIALLECPPELEDVAITIMDGPFFSCIPFPAEGKHSLTHVSLTPHLRWESKPSVNPYDLLKQKKWQPRASRMLSQASSFVPLLSRAVLAESIFEIKTVATVEDSRDGRPIFIRRSNGVPELFHILGSKIDNVYDVLEYLEALDLSRSASR